MVTDWLVGLGYALGGSGAFRSRVGGAFGRWESLGRRRRRSFFWVVWLVWPEGEVGTRD